MPFYCKGGFPHNYASVWYSANEVDRLCFKKTIMHVQLEARRKAEREASEQNRAIMLQSRLQQQYERQLEREAIRSSIQSEVRW